MTTETTKTEATGSTEAKEEAQNQSTEDSQNEETNEQEGSEQEEAGEVGLADLPDSWQSEIKRLRSEAARHRTANKELTEQLSNAKSQDDFDTLKSEMGGTISQLERDLAFERHTRGIPEELLEFVTGDTEDELKASAEKVRALGDRLTPSGQEGGNPRGGMDPTQRTGSLDPHELAKAARAANRRRF